ncbi:MAG TPA: PIN domain-containing protein [Acidobacteriota bacterium]|nr:PIN domain-containing protein [Acidobacteriota bacterium]
MHLEPVRKRLRQSSKRVKSRHLRHHGLGSCLQRPRRQRARRHKASPIFAYHHIPLTEPVFQRAIEIQSKLAKIGRHRLPIPDLIIAATAELHNLTILHYDRDFDRIAEATQQLAGWIIPQGSL